MTKTKILVTGVNGQLGQCLKRVSKEIEANFEFFFFDTENLDITNDNAVFDCFNDHNFSYCINCAAYTAVDRAEEEKEKAYSVNVKGVEHLVNACLKTNTVLIHISTDFVFDGNSNRPYRETDKTNPISVYGKTKLLGENTITNTLDKYFILRTSWLYSEYGNNFVKTMLRLGHEKKQLSVVADQIGAPTYAIDLAHTIFSIIKKANPRYGVYQYSNDGAISWYDFAKKIFELSNITIDLLPINTQAYPTLAKRPKYSVMDKQKIKQNFEVETPLWDDSLKKCLNNLQK